MVKRTKEFKENKSKRCKPKLGRPKSRMGTLMTDIPGINILTETEIPSNVENIGKVNLLRRKQPKRPTSALGFMDFLPDEIKFQIFSYLPDMDLARLGSCSKEASNLVLEYIHTRPKIAEISKIMNERDISIMTVQCYDLGYLLRSLLATYSFDEVVETMKKYLILLADEIWKETDKSVVNDVAKAEEPAQHIVALGLIFKTFLSGRDFKYYCKVVGVVNTVAVQYGYEFNVLYASVLADSRAEMKIRRLYRGLFLDPSHSDEALEALWLHALLNNLQPRQRARLFCIMCGPVRQGAVMWHVLPIFNAEIAVHGKKMVLEMARALRILHMFTVWRPEELVHLIRELVRLPHAWTSLNTALLLMYSCQDLIITYLTQMVEAGLANIDNLFTAKALHLFPGMRVTIAMDRMVYTFLSFVRAQVIYSEDVFHVNLTEVAKAMISALPHPVLKKHFTSELLRKSVADLRHLLLYAHPMDRNILLRSLRVVDVVRQMWMEIW